MVLLDSCSEHHPHLAITCDARDSLLHDAHVMSEREHVEAKQQQELKSYLKQVCDMACDVM